MKSLLRLLDAAYKDQPKVFQLRIFATNKHVKMILSEEDGVLDCEIDNFLYNMGDNWYDIHITFKYKIPDWYIKDWNYEQKLHNIDMGCVEESYIDVFKGYITMSHFNEEESIKDLNIEKKSLSLGKEKDVNRICRSYRKKIREYENLQIDLEMLEMRIEDEKSDYEFNKMELHKYKDTLDSFS